MRRKMSIILCLALLIQLAPVLSTAAPTTNVITTVLEENDSRLTYEGNWSQVNSSNYYGNKSAFSVDRKAAVSTSFAGTGFRYTGTLAATHLPLEVWIDGALHSSIDTKSNSTKNKQKLFETLNLPYGTHTVRIIVAGGNTGNASSNIISLDRIEFIVNVPTTPDGVSIKQDDQEVTVSWKKSSSASSYNVYRSIKGSSEAVKINASPVEGTQFVDQEVKLASIPSTQSVSYQVSSVGDGGIESELTTKKSINLLSNHVKEPSNVKANVRAGNVVALSWKEEDNATGYRIYRSDTKDGTYELIGDEFLNPTNSFTDLDIQGQFYPSKATVYYKISAVGQFNESALTSAISVSMNATQGPANLLIDSEFDDEANQFNVSLQWTSVAGAVGYRIYQLNPTGKLFVPLDDEIVVGGMTQFTVENRNLTKDSKNTYAVTAVDSIGKESAFSRSVDVVIPKNTASTPKSFRASNVNNIITLSWSPSASAVGYKVFRSSSRDSGYTLISGAQLLTNTAYVDSTFAQLAIPTGKQYFYKIQAFNRFGEASSYTHHVTVSRKAPSKPQLAEINYSDRLLTLQWPQVTGAVQYKVYTYVRTKHSYSLVSSETVTSNRYQYEFQDKHQPTDLRYYYAVSAKDSAGNESALSHKKSLLIANTVPGVPTRLKYVNNNNAITLTWTASKDATGYNVYRSTTKTGNSYVLVNQAGPITANEYVDLTYVGLNVQSTVKAYYKVTAVNRFAVQSQQSSILTATLTTPQGPNITSTELVNDHLTISWNPVQGVTGYVLLRSMQSNKNFVPVANLLTSSSYDDYVAGATFNVDTTYYYVVKSIDALGRESKYSNVASAKVLANTASIPAGVTSTVINNSNVILNWMLSNHAASYNVYKQDAAGTFVRLAAGVTSSSYTDVVITEETTNYIYAISAVNPYGTESALSQQAIATVQPLSIPQNLGVASDGSSANLTWEAVDGVIGYRIYQSTQADMGFTYLGEASETSYATQLVTGTVEADFIYYYAVTALYPVGHESALSNIGSAAVSANIASAPSLNNFSVSASNQVTLNWDTSNRAVAYNIYRRSITDNTEFSLVNVSGPVTSTSFVDTQLSSSDDVLGDSFGYIVKALNAYNSESIASNELQVLITAPVIPSLVTASVSAAGDLVTVNWSQSDGAIGYRVYRSNNDGDTYTLISTDLVNGLAYTDPFNFTIQEGLTLEYAVTAIYHPTFETQKSTSVQAFIGANVASIPDSVRANSLNGRTTIEWNPATNAIGYKVYRQQDTGNYQNISGSSAITGNSFVDESLAQVFHNSDTEYQYAVSATNQYNTESPKSEAVSLFIEASPKLQLAAMCSVDPVLTRTWRVRNDNAFPLTFTLKVVGSSQSTEHTIAANTEIIIDTIALAGTNTSRILVNGVEHAWKENVGAECPKPIEEFNSGLIRNGSFEYYTGTNGVADGWTLLKSTGAVGDFAVVTEPVTTGTKSQRISGSSIPNAGAVMISQKVNVSPEHFVTVKGKFNVTSLVNARLQVQVDYYDAQNNLLTSFLRQQLTTTDGYIEMINTRYSPIGTSYVNVSLVLRAVGNNASGTLYVDELQLTTLDQGAPNITTIDPANGAKSVPLNQLIAVTFNEAVQAGTNIASVTLTTGGTIVPIVVNVSGNLLTIKPNFDLLPEKQYIVNVPVGSVKDIAGNAMVSVFNSSFTTGYSSHLVNGGFEYYTATNGVGDGWTFSKSNGAVGNSEVVADLVASGYKSQKIVGSNIPSSGVLMLSQKVAVAPEHIVTVKGKFNVMSLNNSRLQIQVDYYDAQSNLLVSNLSQQLTTTDGYIELKNFRFSPIGTAYVNVTILLRSLANNASGTFYVDELELTTLDQGAPTVTSIDPASGASTFPINKLITVTYNEAVQSGSNISGITLTTGTTNEPFTAQFNGNKFIITPDKDLKPEKLYTLNIPIGAIKDIAGNATTIKYTSSFTTQLNTNFINGGFENYTGINGIGDGWKSSKTSGVVENFEVVSSPVASGTKAQKISGSGMANGGAVMIYQKIAVTPERIASVLGKINVISLNNTRVQLQLDYYDASNNLLVSNLRQQLTTTDGYIDIENTRWSPAGTAYVNASIILRSVGANGSGTFYVDSLDLSSN